LARCAAKLAALGRAGLAGFRALREAWLNLAEGAIWSAGRASGFSGLRSTFVPARLGGGALRALRKLTLARFARLGLAVLAFGGPAEVVDLFLVEFTDLSRLEIENERSVTDAADLLNMVADFFEHFAQFAVAAFDENYLIPGIIDRTRGTTFAGGFAGTEGSDLSRSCLDAV
jgi:hypothetical protein